MDRSFVKTTYGHVVQVFDKDGKFVDQEFIAGDMVDFEDGDGNPLDIDDTDKLEYKPFFMEGERPSALQREENADGETDFVMTGDNVWISAGGLSIQIRHNAEADEDLGEVRIAIYDKGKEDGPAKNVIGSIYGG